MPTQGDASQTGTRLLNQLAENESPRLGLGMTSLVLGTVGLLLTFLPILGLPISAFGLLFGIIGFMAALLLTGATLRWSVAGIFISGLALAANIAITFAPAGYLPSRDVPKSWQPVPKQPFVPPPADSTPP